MTALRFKELVIASHNAGKIREIQELLTPMRIKVRSSSDFRLEEPEENGSSFAENAAIKSRYTAQHTRLVSLSDDSGLVVPALDGAPGIYSARWAGPGKDFAAAMQRVEAALRERGVDPASGVEAHFVCVLSLCFPHGQQVAFEGKVHGTLTFPPRGAQGFGYDPIFVPLGHHLTFGEMDPAAKHAISHRAQAFHRFAAFVQSLEQVSA